MDYNEFPLSFSMTFRILNMVRNRENLQEEDFWRVKRYLEVHFWIQGSKSSRFGIFRFVRSKPIQKLSLFWSKNIHVETFTTNCGRPAGSGDGFLMEIYKTVKNRFSREFSHDNRGVGAQVER